MEIQHSTGSGNTDPLLNKNTTAENPAPETAAQKPRTAGNVKRVTAAALTAVLIAGGIYAATAAGNQPAPTPTPTPTPVQPEVTKNVLWTQLLDMREQPVLKDASLFVCSTRDGVSFLNTQPEQRQLYSPALSIVPVDGGGVNVTFGETECSHPIVMNGDFSDEQLAEVMTTTNALAEQYALPQPGALEDGRYLIEPLLLGTTTDTPAEYVGVASVAARLAQIGQPNSPVMEPRYIDETLAMNVADILRLLSYSDEATLRSVTVDDSVLQAAVDVLTSTLTETERLN